MVSTNLMMTNKFMIAAVELVFGLTFTFHKERGYWATAKVTCERYGQRLAAVDTAESLAALREHLQWRIQDFPQGGANSQKCYYSSIFCRKLHENERI